MTLAVLDLVHWIDSHVDLKPKKLRARTLEIHPTGFKAPVDSVGPMLYSSNRWLRIVVLLRFDSYCIYGTPSTYS